MSNPDGCVMLTLMTSAICLGSCINKGVSVTHPYTSYLLLFLCLPRKPITSPVHGCSAQFGFKVLLLGVIFDLSVFFKNAYCRLQVFPISDITLIHAYPLACFLCLPETLCIFWVIVLPLAVTIKTFFTATHPSETVFSTSLMLSFKLSLTLIHIYPGWIVPLPINIEK